jgi:hypothetical protein
MAHRRETLNAPGVGRGIKPAPDDAREAGPRDLLALLTIAARLLAKRRNHV